MRRAFHFVRRHFPLLLIAGAFALSGLSIALRKIPEDRPGEIVIRLGHWQLEAGVRDAIDRMAEEYRKLHPNVRIVQQAIPETTYQQWVSTQLIGGTAPDIIQAGNMPANLLLSFYTRYFLPVTDFVQEPNPYNAGTELEGVPLQQTYKDAMRSGYVEVLQEFMAIPLSQFGFRIFYNKDLLEKLTGRRDAPTDYREFLALCEKIRRQVNEKGLPYIPIASSQYHHRMWDWRLFDPMTFSALRKGDFSRDGTLAKDEMFVAIRAGLLDFHHPAYRARLELVRDLTPNFQTGFTGLTRDEAVFLFAQERAVFMPIGTYEARTLQKQSEGQFEIGVMNFPWPEATDPQYGRFIEGPPYEEILVGFMFGVTRFSRHPEIALDFLRFMASQQKNEELNEIIGWIPAIKGARVDPALSAFEPNFRGVYKAWDISLGGETIIKWEQLYSLYQVGQISLDDLLDEYGQLYRTRGLRDFLEQKRDWRRALIRDEQMIEGFRAAARLETDPEEAEILWTKQRNLVRGRLLRPEIANARQLRQVDDPSLVEPFGPYEYTPKAKARLHAEAGPTPLPAVEGEPSQPPSTTAP